MDNSGTSPSDSHVEVATRSNVSKTKAVWFSDQFRCRAIVHLAAALEHFAQGPSRTFRSSILRDHESDNEDVD